MPRLPGEKYLLDQPIWDTVQLTAVANATYNFFLVPLGGLLIAGVVKGYQHTNLVQAGVLEMGTTFSITAFSMHVRPLAQGGAAATLADVRTANTGAINVLIGQTSFFRCPTPLVPNGGAEIFLNDTATVNANRGWPTTQNRYHLKHPIAIDGQEAIQVELTVPGTIVAVTDVTFVMWGDMLRPVR